MSIHRSYFNRNNTIQYNSFTNTGKSPWTELYFGSANDSISPSGFSRFIFDLDLSSLTEKFSNKTISTGCTGFSGITHTLRMTNTSSFDDGLLNDTTSTGNRRATSFDLILFRIPLTSGSTGIAQSWDEGVGYDYYNVAKTLNTSNGLLTPIALPHDKSSSQRPSNWFQTTTLSGWSTNGIYNNTTGGNVNYSDLIIVDTQHFEFGNEDIEFNMTNEINQYLTGSTSGFTGWGIAYLPQLENLTGLTENYSVGFFTRHTQTFYDPFLETNYDDLVQDDRNSFYSNKSNNLYLYTYIDGDPITLDDLPIVTIENNNGDVVGVYTSCIKTQGIYEITTTAMTATTPCMFTDSWSNLSYNNVSIPNVVNDLTLLPYKFGFSLSPKSKDPELYGFDFYGIKQDEKVLNTDIRRVGVVIKKAYTSSQILTPVSSYYRVYVMEGTTEVQVQDWTQVNRSSNEYYFVFDTRDKIPNEYNIDIKVYSSGEVNTYKKTLTFQIVDKK
ncbi:hypothetical protein UFOVP117_349 [uncultured Caudovirales phage]|uniref:Uncharacterized protein n=1 Tax=uncultured Caudovirales phage TaxID=2100421 RepID=A0A6J5L6N6_9CAUD|nr:hypothetical protein UFOVP117_349 [uncultured Caudovirales phage]